VFDFLPEHSHYLEEKRIENNRKQLVKVLLLVAYFVFWFVLGWFISSYWHWRR